MGYFSNGTEGQLYEEQYCSRCVHRDGKDGQSGCAVWLAHLMDNYEQCNNPDSVLHVLIRQGDRKKGEPWNLECEMFIPRDPMETHPKLPGIMSTAKENTPL